VCKTCIEIKFNGLDTIRCPLSHDDLEEDELEQEECLVEGLIRKKVTPDHNVYNHLQRQLCYCRNKDYGCPQTYTFKKLKVTMI